MAFLHVYQTAVRVMRKFLLFLPFLFLLSSVSKGQDLKARLDFENPGPDIDDAKAWVTVQEGKAPYRFQWSKESVSLLNDTAKGLTEGNSVSVKVWDAREKDTIELDTLIPTSSVSEKLNGTFKPVVGHIEAVLMADPFAKLGLYDPTVMTDHYLMKAPGANDTAVKKITLKEWKVEKGEEVQRGDLIAVVDLEGRSEKVIADRSGTLKPLLQEGESLLDGSQSENLEGKRTPIARIDFDEMRAATNPNGTHKTSEIPFIVIWLVFGAIFFTFKMNWINFRGLRHAGDLIKGKYDKPNDPGEVSHFQALATALSATVGLGNIAGVAIAISVGGPGATFWMILAGLIGMTSKFVECSLGCKYRKINEKGEVAGGPFYYLYEGLRNWGNGWGSLGRTLAIIFTILTIGASLGGGNMFQANQAYNQVATQFPSLEAYRAVFGVVLALLVGIVIIGGIKSIAKVTDKVVPFMSGLYVLVSLIIIGMNFDQLGVVFGHIFDGAFNASSLKGGFIGVLVIGFQRAAFSNEAGIGSAAIAQSAAKTDKPMTAGFVAMIEPLIDTVLVCTMTSLVLIFTGFGNGAEGVEGSRLTTLAYSREIPWFGMVLMVAIVLFAFSTMISWSYYGLKGWKFIFGESNISDYSYKLLFCVFIVIGASSNLGAVMTFSDMMILGMALPNILGLLLLSSEVRRDLKDYFNKIKSGEIPKTRD